MEWLRLCNSRRYQNYFRSLSLAEAFSDHLARKIPSRRVQWISLGAGQGTKEIPFLKALLKFKKTIRYFPLDVSQPLLELAAARGDECGIPTVGFKADMEMPAHLDEIPAPGGNEIRVLSIFGNGLGNVASNGILNLLRMRTRPGDFVVVDGEIFSEEKKVLAGYDHPVNRRFALAPLHSVGITEADGRLRFELLKTKAHAVMLVSKHFRFNRSKKILYSGKELFFPKGKILSMSSSYKYDPDGLASFLEEKRAFQVIEFKRSRDGRFGMWLAKKK